MAIIDRVGHTYMTAGNDLELCFFSEESVLKMVQNNPVKYTFEPFRRDTEAERKTIIWLDWKCEEEIHRQERLVRDIGIKTASQIILSYHTPTHSFRHILQPPAPLFHFRDYK